MNEDRMPMDEGTIPPPQPLLTRARAGGEGVNAQLLIGPRPADKGQFTSGVQALDTQIQRIH